MRTGGVRSAGPSQAAEGYLDLTSPDFEDGGPLPLKYGGNNPQNPNCTEANASPALPWKNAPDGAKSFAIIQAGMSPDEFTKVVQAAGGKLLQSVSLVSRYGH